MEMSRIMDIGRLIFSRVRELGFGDEVLERFLSDPAVQKDAAMGLIEAATRTQDSFVLFTDVNRDLDTQQLLDIVKSEWPLDVKNFFYPEGVPKIPSLGSGLNENVPVIFFNPGRLITWHELQYECKSRNITLDPRAQLAINVKYPEIARNFPNSTYWEDEDGSRHCVLFSYANGQNHSVAYSFLNGDGFLSGKWFVGTPVRQAS